MKNIFFITLILAFSLNAFSQDIDDLLDEVTGDETHVTQATFKSTRIVNGHSIERMPKNQLDFRVAHRFGQLNTGSYNFWGLDEANIHIGLDYGITDWLMVGYGRGTYEKTYDVLMKASILRQSEGKRNIPVSVSWLSTMAMATINWYKPGKEYLTDRMSYVHQILVGRKFNDRFSAEINPTYIHRNLVATELDPNDVWSVGFGSRVKLTKRVTVNVEYYYVIPPINDYRSEVTYNPLSLGFDIETGGHVFQVFMSNSVAMIEKAFIAETTGQWRDGGIHVGFNVSRVFNLQKQE